MKRAIVITAMLIFAVLSARATVDLTLYNSFPLLDSNGSTPLEGLSTSGDLVQLILVGPNGVIDSPDSFGNPGGDDTVLFTTHVGAGLPTTNTGFLVQSSILYPDIFGGNTNAYVRFWNSNTQANASFYGTSSVFTLPAGDSFGLAEFDFAPLSGSSRTANIPFGAASAVPEPSSLFILGLAIVGGWMYRKHRKGIKLFSIAAALGALAQTTHAQIGAPLDVTASAAILNFDGAMLPGNNPVAPSPIPGALVQLISVGANGVADLPNLDGTPGGDDTVVATTVIGQGIDPAIDQSGRFSTSFFPAPTEGSKLYARIFNAPTLAAATYYGQSAAFTIHNVDVFDLSARGLKWTTQPKGSNPAVTDSDNDGQTDLQELIANTNPLDPNDRLDAGVFASNGNGISLDVAGRAGRMYVLQRTTNDLTAPAWSDIVTNDALSADTNLILSDPNPPNTSKAFYRVRVIMP